MPAKHFFCQKIVCEEPSLQKHLGLLRGHFLFRKTINYFSTAAAADDDDADESCSVEIISRNPTFLNSLSGVPFPGSYFFFFSTT